MRWFEQQWEGSAKKQRWILIVEALVKELWLKYKGRSSASNLPSIYSLLEPLKLGKIYTFA